MVAGSDGHAHSPAPGVEGTGARWLSAALALILAFMAGEVVAGLAAHSLALISDAAHMLTDAAAIALVLITGRLAARPPAGGHTADRPGGRRARHAAEPQPRRGVQAHRHRPVCVRGDRHSGNRHPGDRV